MHLSSSNWCPQAGYKPASGSHSPSRPLVAPILFSFVSHIGWDILSYNTRNFLTFANAAAITYGQKIARSLNILAICNSSCVYKRQKIMSIESNRQLLNAGLEKHIANWAKRVEYRLGVRGKKFSSGLF